MTAEALVQIVCDRVGCEGRTPTWPFGTPTKRIAEELILAGWAVTTHGGLTTNWCPLHWPSRIQ